MGKKNIHVDVCEGNLVRDAERKELSNSVVVNFSLAINDSYKDKDYVSYFDFELWGRYADAMYPYLKKGTHIMVYSRPKQQRWEAEDGKTRSKVVFSVDSLRLLSGKSEGSSDAPRESKPPASDYDDDIPF